MEQSSRFVESIFPRQWLVLSLLICLFGAGKGSAAFTTLGFRDGVSGQSARYAYLNSGVELTYFRFHDSPGGGNPYPFVDGKGVVVDHGLSYPNGYIVFTQPADWFELDGSLAIDAYRDSATWSIRAFDRDNVQVAFAEQILTTSFESDGFRWGVGTLRVEALGSIYRIEYQAYDANGIDTMRFSTSEVVVPEPSTVIAGLLLCIPLGIAACRGLRKRHALS